MENRYKKVNETYLKKEYYYNEIKSKLIISIIFIALLPINMYLYDTGIYGQVDLSSKFLFTQFLKDSVRYNIPFTVVMFGSLIIFIKKFIKNKNVYIKVTRSATIINIITLQVFIVIPIIVYFVAPMYIPMCLLVCIPGLNLAIISELTMQFLKKEKVE